MKAASTTEQWLPPLNEATDRAAKLSLASVRRRYRVREVWLFGSRARGDARIDSDADIALLMGGPEGGFVSTKLALDDLAYDAWLTTSCSTQTCTSNRCRRGCRSGWNRRVSPIPG